MKSMAVTQIKKLKTDQKTLAENLKASYVKIDQLVKENETLTQRNKTYMGLYNEQKDFL